jgi:hypothetical protein
VGRYGAGKNQKPEDDDEPRHLWQPLTIKLATPCSKIANPKMSAASALITAKNRRGRASPPPTWTVGPSKAELAGNDSAPPTTATVRLIVAMRGTRPAAESQLIDTIL